VNYIYVQDIKMFLGMFADKLKFLTCGHKGNATVAWITLVQFCAAIFL